MNNSKLLNDILVRAEKIRSDAGAEYISAPCFIVAVYKLCKEQYTGITAYDNCYSPEFCEEERLRYLFGKLFCHASMVMKQIERSLVKTYSQYDTDFLSEYAQIFEKEAHGRGKVMISADVVFVYAVKAFLPVHRYLVQSQYADSFSVSEILADVDKNIYDFLLLEIENLQKMLQRKADEVKKKRDWRPAEKFAQPQDLLNEIYKSVSFSKKENSLELIFPDFFGDTAGGLKLTVCRKDNMYYVHDNGCAYTVLKKNAGEKYEEVISKISDSLALQDEKVFGKFSETKRLLWYLQKLIFIANADLFCDNVNSKVYIFDYTEEPDLSVCDEMDSEDFIDSLKQTVSSAYDNEKGLIVCAATTYYPNSTYATYQIETSGNSIRIKDNAAENVEGSVFENFYWNNTDISLYSDFISPFIKRFGGEFDGKEISVSAEITNGEFVSALYRFINLAVLLSQLGHFIKLPEN